MASHGHQIEYARHEYDKNHWAISMKSFEEYGICTMKADGHFYIVMLNPTNRSGYRLIVRLLPSKDKTINETHNRKYTKSEINGLFIVLGQVSNMLIDYGLIGQVYVLGNNSHSFDKQTKNTIIGQKDEPSMLHGHIIYRGDPENEYIDGIKLKGKCPGFGVAVKSKNDRIESGDDGDEKIPWKGDERDAALGYFKNRIKTLDTRINPVRIIDNNKPFIVEKGAEDLANCSYVSGAILFVALCYLFYPNRNTKVSK